MRKRQDKANGWPVTKCPAGPIHKTAFHDFIYRRCHSSCPQGSAIRGGMGEMLLRANCIRDRVCESCDFEAECIVRRTMYSKFTLRPNYVTNGSVK